MAPPQRTRSKSSSGPLKWADLEVKVQSRPAPGEAELTQEILTMLHRYAEARLRDFGEAVGRTDDVQLTLVGFVEGKVLPFSVRAGLEQRLLLGEEALPGLSLLLSDMAVGDRQEFETVLPEDYPLATVKGKRVVFVAEVNDALEIREPSLDDPELLQSAGCESVKAFFSQAAEAITLEADTLEFHDMLCAVLDALRERAKITVRPERIASMVGAWWWEREGSVLEALDFPQEDRTASEKAWLANTELREEAERRLGNTAVLDIIAAQEGIGPGTPDAEAGSRLTRFSGIPLIQANALLKGAANPTQDLSAYLRVIEHVLERVNIEVVPAKP
ncbi:MAG: hypothetical protein ACKVPX_09665 [Myxococcaceae bacterium]